MLCLLTAALAGAALSAATCRMLWKRRMRRIVPPPEFLPPTELTEWDRRNMAYHEAGHAVCSYYLPEREPLVKITISPSDEAFGMIRTAPRPHHNETRVSLASTLAVMLAGRLSEELLLNEITTSCVHDLAAARSIAEDMVFRFGMGTRVGVAIPARPEGAASGIGGDPLVEADIRQLIRDAEGTARRILNEHRSAVERLAEKLLVCKTMERQEIQEFFTSFAEEA